MVVTFVLMSISPDDQTVTAVARNPRIAVT